MTLNHCWTIIFGKTRLTCDRNSLWCDFFYISDHINFQDHGSCPLQNIRINAEKHPAISPPKSFLIGFLQSLWIIVFSIWTILSRSKHQKIYENYWKHHIHRYTDITYPSLNDPRNLGLSCNVAEMKWLCTRKNTIPEPLNHYTYIQMSIWDYHKSRAHNIFTTLLIVECTTLHGDSFDVRMGAPCHSITIGSEPTL